MSTGEFDLLIEGATVLTMDACGTVVADGVIGVVDGAIALIGKRIPEAHYSATEVIDAGGWWRFRDS